ncbi:HsdM family class I SAM-dependent methyltransferase, partial [Deinococcus saxicola]
MDVVGYYDESLKLPLAIIEIVDNVNDSLGILDSSVQRAYANAQVLGDDVRYVAISDGNKIRWFERTISSKSLKEIEFAPQLHDLNTSKLNSEFTALVDEDQLFDLIGDILNLYKESGIKPNIEALTDINKIILAKKFDEELYEYTDVGRLYQGQNLDISVRQINIIISKISDVNGVDLKELNLNGSKFAIISQVVKLLSKFSLSRLPSAAFENVLWDIYFPILKFDQLSYFTPKSLIDLMVSFANPKGSEAIYDPACGSGALLISAAKYSEIARRGTPPLFGVDIDDSVVEFAVTNLLMSGLKVNQLKRSNSIDQQSKIVPVSYDLILLDPPLGRMSNQGDSNKGLEIDFPESDYLEVNLISIAIMRLKNQGRGIFLIPDNLLKAPRFSIFRSWLLDRVK